MALLLLLPLLLATSAAGAPSMHPRRSAMSVQEVLSLSHIIESHQGPQVLLREAAEQYEEGDLAPGNPKPVAPLHRRGVVAGEAGVERARSRRGSTRPDPELVRSLSLGSLLRTQKSPREILADFSLGSLLKQQQQQQGGEGERGDGATAEESSSEEDDKSNDAADGVTKQGSFKDGAEILEAGGIPGSTMSNAQAARAFRSRWDCLLSREASGWEFVPTPRLLPWPQESPHPLCAMKKGYRGPKANEEVASGVATPDTWGVADSLKYVWRQRNPKACSSSAYGVPNFERLASSDFCSALRRRGGSLFLVGDSLTGHFAVSLRSHLEMMGVPVVPMEPTPSCKVHLQYLAEKGLTPMSGKWPACQRHMICGATKEEGGVELHFVLSERLWRVNSSIHRPLWALQWGEEMAANNASAVILNRGAHLSATRFYVDEIKYSMDAIRSMLPNVLVIFRSTAAGHPDCQLYDKPIAAPLQLKEWPFHWDAFAEQNAIARKAVERIGGVYMEVDSMTSLRPDWHMGGPRNDCLHYCEPGPVDAWVAAFGNILQELS